MASIKANCRKVICIGRNYADHITELSSARPRQPFFFLKPPSSILPPNSGPILKPAGTTLHYETELGLVISPPPSTNKPLKNLPNDDSVMSLISQYFLGLDLTARNVQDEAKKKGLPWSISKGFDTFLPISSTVPLSSIPDPHNIHLKLMINGSTKQSDSTNLMLFQIPRIISDISKVMTLEDGDVILTGTPKGVGPIVAGDELRGWIEVNGKEIGESVIEVGVEDARGGEEGGYEFMET